jgi:PelA/Pel-15E family pectate lyase
VINLKGSDINLENLSFINEYGFNTKEEVLVPCANDSLTKQKKVKKDGHQMVLRSFGTTRLFVKNCIFRSLGGDPVSPWNGEDGMFYFKDCIIEGGVDLYCPRGWSLADNCQFICHSKEAAIWHDGSKNEQSKSVFFHCSFTGDDGFKLGRYHRDAQFYLLDCSFAKNMADADIYQKAATPPNVIQWGKRVYYYNCHKEGGDLAWHANNLPASLGINDITAAWVYDYKWKPVTEKAVVEVENITADKQQAYDTVAENMLLYQRSNGGWPKQFEKEKVDYKHVLSPLELSELKAGYESGIDATIDNSATTKEIRYLAKAYKRTADKRFLAAAERGVEYLLKAQYPNGGWPQYYPDFSSYRSQVTYNDNAMINVLNVLVDILEGNNDLGVINESFLKRCTLAMQKGIACILRTQVKQGEKLTAWCAQYDAKTLQPAKARAYELPSLSGQESVGIIRFLMRFENPGKEIIAAVQGGVEWLNKVKIVDYKFKEIVNPKTANGKDKALVPEPGNVTWARFYELDTNEPFFCGRNGEKKKKLEEVEFERRMGYAWYNETPAKLINEEYPKWAAKWIKQ